MIGRAERRGAEQGSGTVEHDDFKRDIPAVQDLGGDAPRLVGHERSKRYPFACGEREDFGNRIGSGNTIDECYRTASLFDDPRQLAEIRQPAFGMKVEPALGELSHLGHAARNRHLFDGVLAQVFEHAADEIPHIDHGDLRQIVKYTGRVFGSGAGGTDDMGKACCPRDVDAAVNGMDPGRAREGDDDPGCAENGDSAQDAEARVQCFGRDPLAVLDGYFDLEIAVRSAHFGDGGSDHLSWHRIDGGLVGWDRQTGTRDGAHARSSFEYNPASARANRGAYQSAMRNVRIVSRIFDDACARPIVAPSARRQAKERLCSSGERNLHRIREFIRQQSGTCSFGSRCRASACRPTSAEVFFAGIHDAFYSEKRPSRHRDGNI